MRSVSFKNLQIISHIDPEVLIRFGLLLLIIIKYNLLLKLRINRSKLIMELGKYLDKILKLVIWD